MAGVDFFFTTFFLAEVGDAVKVNKNRKLKEKQKKQKKKDRKVLSKKDRQYFIHTH